MPVKKQTTTNTRKRTPAKAKPKAKPRGTATKSEAFIYRNNLIGVAIVFILLLAILKAGEVGLLLANGFRYVVGDSYQVFTSFLAILFLYFAVYGKWVNLKGRVYLGFGLTYLGVLVWQSLSFFTNANVRSGELTVLSNAIKSDMVNHLAQSDVGGGAIGALMYGAVAPLVANWGTIVIAIGLIIAGIIVLFDLPLQKTLGIFFNSLGIFGHKTAQSAQKVSEELQKRTEQIKTELEATREAERQARIDNILDQDLFPASKPLPTPKAMAPDKAATDSVAPASLASETVTPKISTFDIKQLDQSLAPVEPAEPVFKTPGTPTMSAPVVEDEGPVVPTSDWTTKPTPDPMAADAFDLPTDVEPNDVQPPVPTMASPSENGFDEQDYQLPSTNLLDQVKQTDQSADYQQIKEKSQILQQTLKSFNIDVTVESVALGPTVTQYEIKPAIGTRLSKITGLAQDLALALAATSVRIEAPIPGKSLVGIEVPNAHQAMIGFRDVFENSPQDEEGQLEVPIGRGITGEVVTADIGKMPHLLIAGQTGSGKSVAINGIIAGLLMKNKPSDLKMVMVDPKQVELSIYNDIPHLLTPVVSDPRKAARALQKVAKIMDDRYKLLATVGVRKISEYNKQIEAYNGEHQTGYVKMPYIVVVVDEMADLMIQVKSEVEQPIIRIAQLGRAAGIHMILATQRPTVDVITGLIKANVPSRIAFAVASGMDSRTILDKNGAEQLLGHGDMLFEPSGKPSQRVQGAFISDRDVNNLVDFIKAQTTADYDDSITEEIESDADGGDGDNGAPAHDMQWADVLEFIVREQKASTSLLQRRFGFGYNRAARIIDQLEAEGYIGPNNGSKPREVYLQSLDDAK
ncbi:DNA translocase FtsK [Periweissella ghanensis]|uniref:DNA translocase FtsK n=1 Tax=Periweissella ghanensis TaxID=467997 RepID=A0ABM8ZAS3_9LACO|nr:DNA translocase FtsK [Periweissella ghanensis]MCM0600771.1 DNA translocase FtsK [Periweissella ghanensis]CAH0418587.1 DNA translocase FtsK [Periweissella ghanensis]